MTGRRRGALATIALAVLALVAIAPATAQAAGPAVGTATPTQTVEWWRAFLGGAPLDSCDVVVGGVLYLAGTAGTTESRSCAVPAGTPLLVPLIDGECSVAEGTPEADLVQCARAQGDGFTGLSLKIDGKPVQGLSALRVTTGVFRVTVGPDNAFGVRAGSTRSAADGYFAVVPALSPGTHTLAFGGAFRPDAKTVFRTSVTYTLTVG